MFNEEIELVSNVFQTVPPGIQQAEKIYTPVLAHITSAYANDFFKVRSEGMNLTYSITINKYSYSGQKEIRYENKIYKIIRSEGKIYSDNIILTVGEKIGQS